MVSVFLWGVILIASTGATLRIFRLLRVRFACVTEELVFSAAAGLGFLSYLVFFFGSFGWLYKPLWLSLIAVLFLYFQKVFIPVFKTAAAELSGGFQLLEFWEKIPLAFFLVVFFCSLSGALAPATGHDELCYHLYHPKLYVQAHRIYEIPYATNSVWPYLMEMLFTLGLLLKGAGLAKLFHFTMYLLSAGAIFVFLKRFFSSRIAWLGFFIYALTPAVFIQASFAYVENALTCYVFLCFYALFLFFTERRRSWVVLAGVFGGLAASTKLIGLFILPIAALIFSFDFFSSSKKKQSLLGIFLFLVGFTVFSGVWYLRALLLRGNPVFPFYPQFFGGHGWQDPSYMGVHGRGRDIFSFFIFLWDVTMHPGWFGGEHIGILYLIFLPVLLWARPLPAPIKFILFCSIAYAFLWHNTDPNVRFLFPALAMFSAASAFTADLLIGNRPSFFNRSIRMLYSTFLLMQSLFAIYHFKDEFLLLMRGGEDRYLYEKERTYAAARQINSYLKAGDKILSVGEIRGYYFDVPFVVESDFSRFTSYGSRYFSWDETVNFLKKEGFTHLLNTVGNYQKSREGFNALRLLQETSAARAFLKQEMIVSHRGTRYVLYRIL